jgi:hypothetical protein
MKQAARRVIPVLVVMVVLTGLLWYGDAPRIASMVARFHPIYILWFVLLRLLHEVLRATLWLILLKALGLPVPVRTRIFAFAFAEAFNAVPGGAFLENAILQRAGGSSFGRSSAATTVMILGEIAIGLLGVVALGIGSWGVWLRIAIVVAGVIAVVVGVLHLVAPRAPHLPRQLREHHQLVRALEEVDRFRSGAALLMHPSIIAITLVLCALYVLVSGSALYLVVNGLGILGVSYWQTLAVTCFGLGFYAVLGSLEASEVAIFIGMGLNKSAAVSAVLLNRALDICVTVLLAVLVMAILRDQWRSLRRSRP